MLFEVLIQSFIDLPIAVEPGQTIAQTSPMGQVAQLIQSIQPQTEVDHLRKAADRLLTFAEGTVRVAMSPPTDRPAVDAPDGWKAIQVSNGVTAYASPVEETVIPAIAYDQRLVTRPDYRLFYSEEDSSGNSFVPFSNNVAQDTSVSSDMNDGTYNWTHDWVNELSLTSQPILDPGFDGTRHPYVSTVSYAQLMASEIAPDRYIWTDTWEGEGYDRERDQNGQLISQREGGADIHVGISFDATITDPNQPNLRIVLINDQAVTAQVTNLSAFLMDQLSGESIDRIDFAQLPPTYEVILSKNGGFRGTELKILEPLGTLVFEYHVTRPELKAMFPLKLQGINHFFDERLQEIANLEQQGWLILEVPPPS
ncbi:MAG: hypothetical protein MUF49_14800 [Oculatellaceae cyanobacterium Prado106]|jgi:hypothetical protein|nr:hypothetical protein [Oculatellaceae cyanobacterium Prado106]